MVDDRLLERFLSQPQSVSRDDVDYLLDKIDRLSLGAGHEAVEVAAA